MQPTEGNDMPTINNHSEVIATASAYLLDKIDEDLFDYIAELADLTPTPGEGEQWIAEADTLLSMVPEVVLAAITGMGITPDQLAEYQANLNDSTEPTIQDWIDSDIDQVSDRL